MPQILPGVITKQSAADFQGWNAPPPVPDVQNCRMYYNSDTNTVHVIDPTGADILATAGGGVTATTNDINVTGTIVANNMIFGWAGTLAAGRLNANVVQNVTNDTNLHGLISAQNLTLSWSGLLGANRGGLGVDISATGGATQFIAQDASHIVSVRALIAADVPNIAESQVTNLVTDLAAKQATSAKGVANGYASLDSGGLVPLAQLPSIVGGTTYAGNWNATTNSPTLASSSGTQGFFYIVSVAGSTTLNGISSWSIGDYAIFNGSIWQKIPSFQAVTSVAGRTGAIVLGESDITNLTTDLALLAPLISPALTGNPTAPTQSAGNNSTRLATTAYADAAVLVEMTARVSADALKANLASPAFTGIPTAPTAAVDTNTTQLATTAFVLAQAGAAPPIINGIATVGTSTRYSRQDHIHPTDISRAALASPVFTGVPQAPTAAFSTNTTQIATTAFVQSAIFGGSGAVLLAPTGIQTISGGFPLINAGSYIGVTNPSASPSDASLRMSVSNAGRSSIVNSGAFQSTIFFDYDGGIVVNPAAASANGLTINNSPVLITYGGSGAALTLSSTSASVGGLAIGEVGTSIQRGPAGAGLFHVQWPTASGTVALSNLITAAPLTVSGNGNVAVTGVIFQTVEATGGVGGISLVLQGTSMTVGYCYTLKKVDSGVGAITITDSTSKLFDGDSSYILSDQWQFVTVQWTGSRFDIIGAN